ncbi:MAG: hypothetical protein FJ388_12795 [Verrucomicrobia bacterium]|nr:hypothetical protein [Verrucomicrobiota bacterium]
MTIRHRTLTVVSSALATLALAGWLCAQEPERPREPRPPEGRGDGPRRGEFRPMGAMLTQIAANESFVFIVRGNTLYKYDIKTLKLEGKAELEAPPMPMGPPPGAGPEGRPPREGGPEGRRPPVE